MQLNDHVEEFWRTAELFQDLPHSFSIHSVKCVSQVDECHMQSIVLLPALFLELSENKHHGHKAPLGSEATLVVGAFQQ